MNILMVRWRSICEPDIIEAFKAAGQEITVWNQKIKNVDYDREVPEKLSDPLLLGNYDFVFTVDYFPVIAKTCN